MTIENNSSAPLSVLNNKLAKHKLKPLQASMMMDG